MVGVLVEAVLHELMDSLSCKAGGALLMFVTSAETHIVWWDLSELIDAFSGPISLILPMIKTLILQLLVKSSKSRTFQYVIIEK